MKKTRVYLAAVLMLVSASGMFGQTGSTGSILGSVKDTSGAVLANATVLVTNTATGVVTKAGTTSTGTTRRST